MQGRIIKGIGSFYYVLSEKAVYTCRARGRFREDGISPQVGDEVLFHWDEQDEGYIDEILPRRNLIKRPPVANIDRLIWVLSAGRPQADLLLLDKMLIFCAMNHIDAAIVINKCDTVPKEQAREIGQAYKGSGAQVFYTSAAEKWGIEELSELISTGTSCFAGQSGAGKSSLLNVLLPNYGSETGELARTGRGRHTTRRAELLAYRDGFVADTPGFSLLDMDTIPPETLQDYYAEFAPYRHQCRFNACTHQNEPDCAVREALSKGIIHEKRYERYITLLQEAKINWRKRYD